MSDRSLYLQEESGLLACYGKSFQRHDDDCIECSVQADCESLTDLRRQRKRSNIAKKPSPNVEEEKPDEEMYDNERVPWAPPVSRKKSSTTKVKTHYQQPHPVPFYGYPYQHHEEVPQQYQQQYLQYQQQQQYMMPLPIPPQPVLPYLQPGTYQTTHPVAHPSPHLNYIMANPIDCPMPRPGESWYSRFGKNLLSTMLAEGGRLVYEWFRRHKW